MKEYSFQSRTQRYKLPNGITVLALENRANPTVSLSGLLMAGDYFSPANQHGIAGLTAGMLNKGTASRTKLEIAEALESVGARLAISANTFTVSVSAQSLSRDFGLVLSTLADELLQPSFPADELTKLKQRTTASIKHNQEETRVRAIERLTQVIYPPQNPFYQPTAEQLLNEIEEMSVDAIGTFHRERYGPGSLLLVVVGDIDAESVHEQVANLLGDWSGPAPGAIDLPFTPLQATPTREFVPMKDKPNVDIVIGHASGLRRSSPDYLAANIANRALGQSTLSSRLGLKVRDEMGLTYGINSAFMESGLGDGPFLVSVTVAPSNVELAIKASLEIVDEFVAGGIRDEELQDEQSAWTGSFKIGLATNSGMAAQLASAELHGLGVHHLDIFPELVTAVTKSEVNEAIRRYLHPERATTVIAGTLD